MSTKKMTAELRLSHWAQVMRERVESGLNIKDYCEKRGIHTNTYYYWQSKLRKTVGGQLMDLRENSLQLEHPSFMEVKPDTINQLDRSDYSRQNDVVQVEINGMHIRANSEYPVDNLISRRV